MKHKHHIIPKHLGGSDTAENIVELSIEEHADAHKCLYELHGHWQDFIAWKGLSGLLTSDECNFLAIKEGGRRGNLISTGGWLFTNGDEIKKFHPDNVPEGWYKYKKETRISGYGSGTKNRTWYHDPNNPSKKQALLPTEDIPDGWVIGKGKSKRVKCFWFNDGKNEGQFKLDNYPDGWQRGRLKSVLQKSFKNVIL